jgi:hypothetical protein
MRRTLTFSRDKYTMENRLNHTLNGVHPETPGNFQKEWGWGFPGANSTDLM